MKILVITLLVIYVITGCNKSKCNDDNGDFAATVYEGSLKLDFIDKATGQNLFRDTNPLYDKNKVTVTDVFNNPLRIEFVKTMTIGQSVLYYTLNIYNIILRTDDISKELCKKAYINFGTDKDTIDYCMSVQALNCGSEFRNIKVDFNEKEIGSAQNDIFFYGKITK